MKRWISVVAVLVLVLAACTGGTTEDTTATTAGDTTVPDTTEGDTTSTTAAETPDTTGAPAGEADGTIIIGTTDTIASLDPADAYAIHDWELLKNINEGLLRWRPGELELTTGLAEEMPEVSEDGLVYTVRMREGVQFSDGTELTAEMYAEQLNRLLTIGPDCPNGVANALATPFLESIEALDSSTLQFTLTRPVAYFPQLLATAAFLPAHPDTFPADECVTFPEAPVHGTGPWYITEYTQGEQTVLEPNPNYTGELQPQVDRIIIRYFSDPQTMALAVQNGDIDIAWRILGAELVSELEGAEGLTIGAIEGGSIRYLILNYAMEPMDDINVRKAVASAIDRDEIVDVVYGGQVEPLYSMVPPGFIGATEIFDEMYQSPDLDAARAYLAESGYDENNPLELELWYPPEHYGAATADWMQLIEQQLEATGVIDVTLQPQEWSTYVTALTGGEAYPGGVLGWFFDFPDSSNYLEPFVFNGGLGTMVTSPEGEPINDQAAQLVDLLNEASVEQDEDARAALYEEIQEIYADLVVTLPIYFETEHVVPRDGVSGSDEYASPETLNVGPNWGFYSSVLSENGGGEGWGAGLSPPPRTTHRSESIVLSPLALIFLIIGIPALIGLAYIFVRGSAGLRRYILTRIGLLIPMVFILASLVFFVMRVLPGDPVRSSLGPKGSAETVARMREQLGLDDPLIVQYGRFLGDIVTLDFGNSLTGGRRPIIDEMSERFPATLELVIPAAGLALLIGIVGGTLAAARRKRPFDYALRLYSVVIYSIPVFWLGLIFQLVFGVRLGWTPIAGRIDPVIATTLERTTNILWLDAIITGNWAALWSSLSHLVLPVVTLGLILSGVFLRLTRVNVIETLQMEYIGAARARGIRERIVVGSHALKNAIIPVITLLGLQVAILLAGAVLTETVFSWPGMGQYLVQRISSRDYTAVQSVITMFAMLVALISLAVDIVYSLVDPRVRY